MANNYISIKVIADKVLRHPMMAGISFEAIIDYTVDFMRIVGCCGFFEEKICPIEIIEYRGVLPDDFYEMNQVRVSAYFEKVAEYEEDFFITEDNIVIPLGTSKQKFDEFGNPIYKITSVPSNQVLRYSTDSFHMSDIKDCDDYTYKLQGGYIYTSLKEGGVEISYQAIPIDDECYPMIPDNSKFLRALEAYIKKQWFTILFDMGKIQGAVLQNVQQEYAWAVGACDADFHSLSLDKAETFFNSWRTAIPRTNEHSRGFATNSRRDNLKF